MSKPSVGFIGLGMMGEPMSKRIVDAGFPVTVFDVRPGQVEKLVKAGAKSARNAREIAEASDIVLTSLPTLAACEETYFGENGLLKAARKGLTLVETSTVTPTVIQGYASEANPKGVAIVDAALLARTTFHPGLDKLKANEIAAQGQVTVVIGGDTGDVERVKPVLSAFGNPLFHMGPLGSGVMIKVLNNATSHAYFVVILEVLAVAAKSGVSLAKLEEIFRNTTACSAPLNDVAAYYLKHGKGKLMNIGSAIKDSEAILEIARQVEVPMLMQNVNHAYYQMAMQRTGSKDGSGDGELMKLFEGFIHMDLRF